MPFVKGQSGNPAGKPKGARDKRTELRALLQPHAEDLVRKAVQLALGGDVGALRLCIDRCIPPIKEDRIDVALPTLSSANECSEAQGLIVQAVASGDLSPSAGASLSGLVENQRRSFETLDLEQRLKTIEERMGVKT